MAASGDTGVISVLQKKIGFMGYRLGVFEKTAIRILLVANILLRI